MMRSRNPSKGMVQNLRKTVKSTDRCINKLHQATEKLRSPTSSIGMQNMLDDSPRVMKTQRTEVCVTEPDKRTRPMTTSHQNRRSVVPRLDDTQRACALPASMVEKL